MHESDFEGKASEDAAEKNGLEFYLRMMISNQ